MEATVPSQVLVGSGAATAGGHARGLAPLQKGLAGSYKVSVHLPSDLAVPLLGIY